MAKKMLKNAMMLGFLALMLGGAIMLLGSGTLGNFFFGGAVCSLNSTANQIECVGALPADTTGFTCDYGGMVTEEGWILPDVGSSIGISCTSFLSQTTVIDCKANTYKFQQEQSIADVTAYRALVVLNDGRQLSTEGYAQPGKSYRSQLNDIFVWMPVDDAWECSGKGARAVLRSYPAKIILPLETAPIVQTATACTEGSQRDSVTCSDGSKIYKEKCENAAWITTGSSCPVYTASISENKEEIKEPVTVGQQPGGAATGEVGTTPIPKPPEEIPIWLVAVVAIFVVVAIAYALRWIK